MSEKFYCWPRWMPIPQRSGYGYEPLDRRSKTDMEAGSLIRVNFDTDETSLDCVLILNAMQSQWFEKFERDMLNQGARWFQMPIQVGGCIEKHTVRFSSRPKAGSLIGATHTTYTLKLELQKRDLQLCAEVAELLLCVTPEELFKASADAGKFWMSLKPLKKPTWILDAVKAAS